MWHPIAKTLCKEPVAYAIAASVVEACERIAVCSHRLPYVLFIAMDASHLTVDEISLIAEAALDSNACWVCAWGLRCELVHDIVDETIVMRDVRFHRESPTVMTTWHTTDSLAEAVLFAVDQVFPVEGWNVTTLPRRLLIVGTVVTPEELVDAVHKALPD